MLEGERAGERVMIGDQQTANTIFGFGSGTIGQGKSGQSEGSMRGLQE